ncbi:uncharacterized protein B0H18DRAFT_980496 [Fomitopsis serialis]|uniref:uncharacterized protein n=1 Tax=Fomitopsis serialis TaxID=139415 RepID=UPI0020073EEB|nr:uncharacterized protein B0H18DRAFT_980496 [Neoantrodia serialis]KAH9934281.1 hypothetical protein B0H18DRAFT_980496 [Neoantrodia serialis]
MKIRTIRGRVLFMSSLAATPCSHCGSTDVASSSSAAPCSTYSYAMYYGSEITCVCFDRSRSHGLKPVPSQQR